MRRKSMPASAPEDNGSPITAYQYSTDDGATWGALAITSLPGTVTLAAESDGTPFAALTAYDTQSIKNEYIEHAQHADQEWLGKSAIMGALRLYLDFINMFMFLLSFLGNRE